MRLSDMLLGSIASSFFLSVLLLPIHVTHALLSSNHQPISDQLQENALLIAQLKSIATERIGSIAEEPYANDVFYLRYCLEYKNDPELAKQVLQRNLDWRLTEPGKSICRSALDAVQSASYDNKWDNEPVLKAAPHSAIVAQYLTPNNCITSTTHQGDLIYCIRAGQIDDNALMNLVSVEQLKDFFLYAKEVNALVSLQRSFANDKLCYVITANDLKGVPLVGGSALFRKALSAASKESDTFYPTTNGPTLLLNLPPLLSALVKLFTPLFPESVKARLRFEQGPLSDVASLRDIAKPGVVRETFLDQIDRIVYNQ